MALSVLPYARCRQDTIALRYIICAIKIAMKDPKIDRQREHQANERTFLAWLRTSIALIGFGFALARFGLFLTQLNLSLTRQNAPLSHFFNSQTLGLSLVILGVVTIALAAWRYNQVFWQIERGDYRPDRLLVWITTGAVILLGGLSIPLILWRDREPTQNPIPQMRLNRQAAQKFRRTGRSHTNLNSI
jgi:putative membrane protein